MTQRDDEVKHFLDDLRSPDSSTRFAAIACLGGMRASEAVAELTRILSDPAESDLNRGRAIVALGEIGRAADSAVSTLIESYPLHLQGGDVNLFILETLRLIGTDEAVAFARKHGEGA